MKEDTVFQAEGVEMKTKERVWITFHDAVPSNSFKQLRKFERQIRRSKILVLISRGERNGKARAVFKFHGGPFHAIIEGKSHG